LTTAGEPAFLLAVIGLINARNAVETETVNLIRLNRAREKRGKAPFFEHKVLKIAVRQQRRVYGEAGSHGDYTPMRGHFVSGHRKVRRTGIFFWHPHARGDFKAVRSRKITKSHYEEEKMIRKRLTIAIAAMLLTGSATAQQSTADGLAKFLLYGELCKPLTPKTREFIEDMVRQVGGDKVRVEGEKILGQIATSPGGSKANIPLFCDAVRPAVETIERKSSP
jgi:hypothetical protein